MKRSFRMSNVAETITFLCLLTAFKNTKGDGGWKTFRRLIPADVLRDFPGECFASTKCGTIEPGHTWELKPFCGRSTCTKSDDGQSNLFELVEDCGPLPKANPKCKKVESKFNKSANFPDCCPVFECEPGIKLEFPDIPRIEETTTISPDQNTPKSKILSPSEGTTKTSAKQNVSKLKKQKVDTILTTEPVEPPNPSLQYRGQFQDT